MRDILQVTAIRLLYADVCLLRPISVKLFSETVAQYPQRWNFVRRLQIYTDKFDASRESEITTQEYPSPLWSDSILRILSEGSRTLSNVHDAGTVLSSSVPLIGTAHWPSWASLQAIALRVPVNRSVETVVQALNAIPRLIELSLIWQVVDKTIFQNFSSEGTPAWHQFPISPGLQLPLLRRFSWDNTQDGVNRVMSMNTIQFLASSLYGNVQYTFAGIFLQWPRRSQAARTLLSAPCERNMGSFGIDSTSNVMDLGVCTQAYTRTCDLLTQTARALPLPQQLRLSAGYIY
jgi:hypothetical protein